MAGTATSRNQICPSNVKFMANNRSKARHRWRIAILKLNAVLEFTELCRNHTMNQANITLNNKMRDIFSNKYNDNIKLIAFGYGIMGIFLYIACNFALTFWPMHNIIENPEYWYEVSIPTVLGYSPISAAVLLKSFVILVGLEEINSWKVWWVMYAASIFTNVAVTILEYVFWVLVYKKRWPMPMYGQIATTAALIAMNVSLWFQYKKNGGVTRSSKDEYC